VDVEYDGDMASEKLMRPTAVDVEFVTDYKLEISD
jgi:hypothetical protein